jgi:hypothetical protein
MLSQAGNLEAQAAALQNALKYGFSKNLRQNLDDVANAYNRQSYLIKDGAAKRGSQLEASAKENQMAANANENQSLSNMVRERQDAMQGILEQGAGETDTTRAMLMAARNMVANQAESNRAYFDTSRSINQSVTDLNVDTKTALGNAFGSLEAERDRLYQDYYNRRSETFTQLGNIRGQQADYYAQATEMGVSPGKTKTAKAKTGMQAAYNYATAEAGKSYKQAALPSGIKNWEGTKQQATRRTNTDLGNAVTIDKAEKAEGSSLRRWEG